MSKLSFRARALDASKPMPIYMAEELPDLPDYSAINRAVPQMPSGMEKEEECEHHLQRAICAGLIIPTPEVAGIPQNDFYDIAYPSTYKQPRQLIYMQPFTMEQDIPDYDMDSDDEIWLQSQTQRLDLTPLKFEEMMDRLEKSSGQTVVTLNEAKALLKEDDDLIIAVFDYWLNKRLKTQHPLILSVKTEQRAGTAANNPYLAFRRRTEKMQTRKNRKNDEVSYEKMLKLKRDFCRAVTLLELVKRREKMKRENVHLTVEIFEKRYHARDFAGTIFSEVGSIKTSSRPAFTPIFHNHYTNQSWSSKSVIKDDGLPRKEKRQYKKRKHKTSHKANALGQDLEVAAVTSDEELGAQALSPEPEETDDEGQFAFRRNKLCSYHMPLPQLGNWPWCSKQENGSAFRKFRYNITSITDRLRERRRCIGYARRRVGRGGRIILDRASTAEDDEFWRTVDFTILENEPSNVPSEMTEPERREPLASSDTNMQVDNSETSNVQVVHTEVKNEIGGSVRTSNSSVHEIASEVKAEPMDCSESDAQQADAAVGTGPLPKEEAQQMLEFLQNMRKEWLHFRPKTPPPEEEPVCNLQPLEESYWKLGSSSPFSLEIQTLESPSALLDTSAFVTDQFNFDNLGTLDIPITDTRQSSDKIVQTGINLNVNVGINTLTPSVNNDKSSFNVNHVDSKSNATNTDADSISNNDRTIGCSKFYVSDLSAGLGAPSSTSTLSTCTFASPKLNSINQASHGQLRPISDAAQNSTNGILPQYGYEKSTGRTKNNKMSYAFPSSVEYPNTNSGISLHTSAHTVTLNSHSANIFEIPISNNTDSGSTDIVNSQCPESSATTSNNNKNKTIVRKNNLAMEVT